MNFMIQTKRLMVNQNNNLNVMLLWITHGKHYKGAFIFQKGAQCPKRFFISFVLLEHKNCSKMIGHMRREKKTHQKTKPLLTWQQVGARDITNYMLSEFMYVCINRSTVLDKISSSGSSNEIILQIFSTLLCAS